jgi:hypothetical protein
MVTYQKKLKLEVRVMKKSLIMLVIMLLVFESVIFKSSADAITTKTSTSLSLEIIGPTSVMAGSYSVPYSAIVSGVTPPYTIEWTNGANGDWNKGVTGGFASFIFPKPGNYVIIAQVKDSQRNTKGASLTVTVYSPFSVSVSGPSKVRVSDPPPTFYANASGGSGWYQYSWNGGSWTNDSSYTYSDFLTLGTHTITVTVKDMATGKTMSASKTFTVKVSWLFH